MNVFRNLSISKCLRFFLYLLVFFQPFNHFNSFREIGFYGLLFFFLLKLLKGEAKEIRLNDKTIIALFLLIAWSLLTSIFGPYPLDSLHAMRTNLLIQTLIFLTIITEFKNASELKTFFWIIVSSFSVVTFISAFEAINLARHHQLIKSHDMYTHEMFISGYPSNATFYLPFIMAWLISFDESRLKKRIGLIVLLTGFLLVFVYSQRTAIIAIPVAAFIMLLLSKKYRLLGIFTVISVLCAILIFSSRSDTLSRYKSLSNPETFFTNKGLSGRLGVWQGALHIIEERPFTGYGYGWKKIAWAIKDLNLAKQWEEKYPDVYAYYIGEAHYSYGRVNPHNLALQIVFEIGIVGFALFALFWATIIIKMFKIFLSGERSEIKSFALCGIGILVSYAIINLTSGLWEESYGNIMLSFAASIFVIYRQYMQNSLKSRDKIY